MADLKEREGVYNLAYLGENQNHYFGWARATDVQVPFEAPEDVEGRFYSMEEAFGISRDTFQITE